MALHQLPWHVVATVDFGQTTNMQCQHGERATCSTAPYLPRAPDAATTLKRSGGDYLDCHSRSCADNPEAFHRIPRIKCGDECGGSAATIIELCPVSFAQAVDVHLEHRPSHTRGRIALLGCDLRAVPTSTRINWRDTRGGNEPVTSMTQSQLERNRFEDSIASGQTPSMLVTERAGVVHTRVSRGGAAHATHEWHQSPATALHNMRRLC